MRDLLIPIWLTTQASAIPLVGEENKNDNFHGVETGNIYKEYEELLVDLRDAMRR